MASQQAAPVVEATDPQSLRLAELRQAVSQAGHLEAPRLFAGESEATIADVLVTLPPALAVAALWELPEQTREAVLQCVPAPRRQQWLRNHDYPSNSIGRLMDVAPAVFGPDDRVDEIVQQLREIVRRALVTYGYVVDSDGRLIGVLIFRELLFARGEQRLSEVMLPNPYSLRADDPVETAMKDMVLRHYPEYPVADALGRLIGIVRGQTIFEQQAFELSAQAGRMVGVEAGERLSTPWQRSLRFRQPWLQLNLLTAFSAAAVVGAFQGTIDRIVILAAFLPVLAGQSGNTGSQALAVTLRGMTLGEFGEDNGRGITFKELVLGLANGVLVGLTAGAGMYFYAARQDNPAALQLAVVVFVAMVVSCIVSGVAGTLVPRVLRRLGADPATASSIFLTTATDVVSMGALLALATLFVD